MRHYKTQSVTFEYFDYIIHATGVTLDRDIDTNEVHGIKVDNEYLDLDFNRIEITENDNSILFEGLPESEQNDILNDLIIEMQNL